MILRKYVIPGIVAALIFSLTAAQISCTPAKKPAPPRPFMPTEPDRITKPARNATELNLLNNRLSSAINRIENVNRATVVVLDTTAFIGLNLKSGLTLSQQNAVKRKCADKAQTVERRIVSTWVTLNPAAIEMIDRARADIKAGKPSSQYSRKLRIILDNSDLIK